MSPEQWERVKDLAAAALEASEAERAAMLAEEGDAEVRREAASLLRFEAAGFLDFDAAPQRVGAFTVERELGRGGMGTVYLCARDDGQFAQRVAVKVIRQGLHSPGARLRFLRERQALARLEHAHIARLLDGGTLPDSRPYFVMELVEGVPIDRYAREAGLREAVMCFGQVCDAVAYAHRALVLHRDVKSANVVVNPETKTAKLLDFGIAKLLDEQEVAETVAGWRPLTMETASPEQLRGEPLTTATDIYSLGVLLYQIAAGKVPFALAGSTLVEAARVVGETRPEPLADGDLDAIARKAMRKEPGERYATVEALGADIARYLAGEPVAARKDEWRYRAGKWLRRRRGWIAAAAVVAGVGAVGLYSTLREAKRADRRFAQLRHFAHTVVFDIHDQVAKLPGSTAVRESLVRESLAYLDGLADEAQTDAVLLRELADSYEKLGTVQGDRRTAHTGQYDDAARALRRAISIRQKLLDARPADGELVLQVGRAAGRLAFVETGRRQWDEARRWADVGVDAAVRGGAKAAEAGARMDRAYVLLQRSEFAPATEDGRRAIALYRELGDRRGLAAALKRTGQLVARQGQRGEAVAMYQEALAMEERDVRERPDDAALRSDLSITYQDLARMQMLAGRAPGAVAFLKRALAIQDELLASDGGNERYRNSVRISLALLAEAESAAQHPRESEVAARRLLEMAQSLPADSPRRREALADAYQAAAEASLAAGRKQAAAELLGKAKGLLVEGEGSVDTKSQLGKIERKLRMIAGQ